MNSVYKVGFVLITAAAVCARVTINEVALEEIDDNTIIGVWNVAKGLIPIYSKCNVDNRNRRTFKCDSTVLICTVYA